MMRFPPFDSSEDFMWRDGLRFYGVINDIIMSDADCTPGREPRSVAASQLLQSIFCLFYSTVIITDFSYFIGIIADLHI